MVAAVSAVVVWGLLTPSPVILTQAGEALPVISTGSGTLLVPTARAQTLSLAEAAWLGVTTDRSGMSTEALGEYAPDARSAQSSQRAAAQAAATLVTARRPDGPAVTAEMVERGDVAGVPAGLALALGYIEQLSGSDLTAGRTIAALGSISPSGEVTPAGDPAPRLGSARQASAAVLLLPEDDPGTAIPQGMTVVPVTTLQQAVDYLCATGGTGPVCPEGWAPHRREGTAADHPAA